MLTRDRRYNAGAKRDANIFQCIVKRRFHVVMRGCVTDKTFLGIPSELTFDTQIQHCIAMEPEVHVCIKHANPTMGFKNADV